MRRGAIFPLGLAQAPSSGGKSRYPKPWLWFQNSMPRFRGFFSSLYFFFWYKTTRPTCASAPSFVSQEDDGCISTVRCQYSLSAVSVSRRPCAFSWRNSFPFTLCTDDFHWHIDCSHPQTLRATGYVLNGPCESEIPRTRQRAILRQSRLAVM